MKNKKVVIAGGTGFIGQSLIRYLGKQNDIVILTRLTDDSNNLYGHRMLTQQKEYRVRYVQWDGKHPEPEWLRELEGSDLIINLSGRSVNCRYHKRQRQEIIESRVNPTIAIGNAIRQLKNPPPIWINASSATIYRHSQSRPNDEFGEISDHKSHNMPYSFLDRIRHRKNKWLAALKYGNDSREYRELDLDFSISVVKQWEKSFFDQETPLTRKIALRMAITLGTGGVLIPFLNLCKFGMGGRHGHGRQMFSWVHEEDVVRMIQWLVERPGSDGIYNCVAPNAISNAKFMKSLRIISKNRIGLPAPATLLELGAFFIGTETELMLKSRWAYPGRALLEGFKFKYNTVDAALKEIITRLNNNSYSFSNGNGAV